MSQSRSSQSRITALLSHTNRAEQNNPHANRNNPTLRRLHQQISNNSDSNPNNPHANLANSTRARLQQQIKDRLESKLRNYRGRIPEGAPLWQTNVETLDGTTLEISSDQALGSTYLLQYLDQKDIAHNLTFGGDCSGPKKEIFNSPDCYDIDYTPWPLDDTEIIINTCGPNATIPAGLLDDLTRICSFPSEAEVSAGNRELLMAVGIPVALMIFLLLCVSCGAGVMEAVEKKRNEPKEGEERKEDETTALLSAEHHGRQSRSP